jgi:hypothetical protein
VTDLVDFESPESTSTDGWKKGDKCYALFRSEEEDQFLTEFYKATVMKVNKVCFCALFSLCIISFRTKHMPFVHLFFVYRKH